MHPEAYEGFGWALKEAGLLTDAPYHILDIGGQNVNGTVHDYFPEATITTLDLENADIIADARTWTPAHRVYDVVIATEVFEHVKGWEDIVNTAALALNPHGPGVFLSTMASWRRPPHGATGAPLPVDGEYYANVAPKDLREVLALHFSRFDTQYRYPPGDLYCWGRL